tara:strand:+ start:94 stop:225 length:132 start_codon:yes stop_codon:yes gene_type:complete
MKTEIKETIKTNGVKTFTLFIDNKIIAECKDINKLKNKLKLTK